MERETLYDYAFGYRQVAMKVLQGDKILSYKTFSPNPIYAP